MDDALCKNFICCLDLVSKFWLKQRYFDKKYFDCNNNPIYPAFFSSLIQFFLLLATIKISEQHALNASIHFYVFFQTLFRILAITSSRYSVYHHLGKVENSSFFTQICTKMDLRLEFQKPNLRIRISILKI